MTQLEDLKHRHEGMMRSADERIREEKMVQEKLRAEIVTNQTQISGLTQMLQEAQVIPDSDWLTQDNNGF